MDSIKPHEKLPVCIVKIGGEYSLIGKVTKAKLIKMSVIADSCIRSGGAGDPKFPPFSVVIGEGAADGTAATRIMEWIEENDLDNPEPLTLAYLKIDQFDELVQIYRTAYAFALRREIRGDDVRDSIHKYVQDTAVAFNEFAMVAELLHFDSGIMRTMMHRVMWGNVKGGVLACPEMDQIVPYAQRMGLWETMLDIEVEIKMKMNRSPEEAHRAKLEKAVKAKAWAKETNWRNGPWTMSTWPRVRRHNLITTSTRSKMSRKNPHLDPINIISPPYTSLSTWPRARRYRFTDRVDAIKMNCKNPNLDSYTMEHSSRLCRGRH